MTLTLTFAFLVFLSLFMQMETFRSKNEEVSFHLAASAIACDSKVFADEQKVEKKKKKRTPSFTQQKKPSQAPVRMRAGINLYDLLLEENTFLLDELFLDLFDHLYQKATFYEPHLKQTLLRALKQKATAKKMESKGKTYLKNLEDLAYVDLEDPKLQKVLYAILRGCESTYEEGGFPSLLDFLVLEHLSGTKINLFEANHTLLMLLFDSSTADYIIRYKHTWDEKEAESAILAFRKQKPSKYSPWIGYKKRK